MDPMMKNEGRRGGRREVREQNIDADLARLGKDGRELLEALHWCERNGMQGFVGFYNELIDEKLRRLPRLPERREAEAR